MRGKIEEQKRNETHKNKKYIGRYKSSYLNNNIKCEWIKQHNLKTEIVKWDFLKFPIQVYIHCIEDTHIRFKDTNRLKIKGWEKIYHANSNNKKSGTAIIISGRINFKTKIVSRGKERNLIRRGKQNNYKHICTK